QEEAQRLGRVLRPKEGNNAAHFYALVSEGTKELEFAMKRQMFLVEQGYRYRSVAWGESLPANGPGGSTAQEGEQAG
ncbi:MAG TPA: helicase, partial [Paenibacillus sp.]|nr:helicase [Paenibacillus sp.]